VTSRDRPMRIVAVQTGLSPLSVLGGTITDREFLTRLADRGVEVHVLAQAGEPIVEHPNFIPHYWRQRVRIPRVPYLSNIDVAWDLRALLRRIGSVDWIRFNSPWGVGIGAVAVAGKYRTWGSYLHCEGDDYWFRKWVDSWLPKHCALLTCLSGDTREDLVARCPAARDRTTVVPLGIDGDRIERAAWRRGEIRRRLGVTSETLILYMGSLIPRKGIDELIASWELVGGRTDVRLLIIGRSRAEREGRLVRALAQRDARVIHLEQAPYEEAAAYFAASDVFFFPTRLEGWGIVVGEAMAAGLPVVTTNAKGVREVVVPDATALVSEVGDTAQLAVGLQRLIAEPAARAELGAAGKRRARERFSWDRIIDSLMAILQDQGEPSDIARVA
jgi:glycosyltransferase involved in cell wall biosynthesis